MEMEVGKRKRARGEVRAIEWSAGLRAMIEETQSLQCTTSLYVFGNSDGQRYTTSGWNTNLRRLMMHAEKKAKEEGVGFVRFTLKGILPAAGTDRVDQGDQGITNATGHSSDPMVRQVDDRRKRRQPGQLNSAICCRIP